MAGVAPNGKGRVNMRAMCPVLGGIMLWALATSGAETTRPPLTAEQIAAAKKQLIGAIPPTRPGAYENQPDAEGRYIYEATSARPIVPGALCLVESNKLVQGLTVVKVGGLVGRGPDGLYNEGVYWTLGAIKPGAYAIGVWYQSGDANREASQGWYAPVQVYLNGRMVQLATHNDPVQVAPGIFFRRGLHGSKGGTASGRRNRRGA